MAPRAATAETPRWSRGQLIAHRFLPMLVLWFALAGGSGSACTVGAPAVVVATWLSVALASGRRVRWRLGPMLRFVPFFVHQTVHGSLDVARRALTPGMPIEPVLVRYEPHLEIDSPAATFFMCMIGLFPGTLCAEIEGDAIQVHVIDRHNPYHRSLGELERRVGAMFGVEVPPAQRRPEQGRP